MARRLGIIRLALLVLLTIGAAFALHPQIWLGGRLITGDQLMRAAAGPYLLPYRFEAPASDVRSVEFQQVRTLVQRDRDATDTALVLIDADRDTRVYLNNIRVTESGSVAGFEERMRAFGLPAAFWHDGGNVLDVITPNIGERSSPALAVLARSDADIAKVWRYIQLSSSVRILVAIAGLLSAAMCFMYLAISQRGRDGRWSLAGLTLSLTLSAVPAALMVGWSVPDSILPTLGMIGAAVAAGLSGLSMRRLAAPRLQNTWVGVSGIIALAAALGLFAGHAGARWGPVYDVWPASVSAAGTALALFFVTSLILALSIAVGRAGIAAVKRSRRQDALIREQENMIAQQSEELEAQIHRRAVLEERERFSRDIHDGLGGSLLSLLVEVRSGKVESKKLEAALEANLDELRMMIDSLDHGEGSLNSALCTFQTRVRQFFDNADIELAWSQADAALPERATPDFILHLYRILQEAASNIVRHSRATRAQYRIEWDEANSLLSVAISDDGAKPEPSQRGHTGNGLTNMARRVEDMRGTFEAGPAPGGGWLIQFSVPV